MIQLHGRKVAFTFTGGVDSVVAIYHTLENDGKYKFLTPMDFPPDYKTSVELILADLGGQANFPIANSLMALHKQALKERYGDKFEFTSTVIEVPMPSWTKDNNPLYKQNYIPPQDGGKTDYNNVRNHEDLGPGAYVDGRSAMLFTWILSYCSVQKIGLLITGHQYDVQEHDKLDSYRMRQEDVGSGFVDRMNLLNECGFRTRTRIEMPLMSNRLSKYEICKLGIELGIELGKTTYSCLFYPPCGKCGACVIREKAFAILRIKDEAHSVFIKTQQSPNGSTHDRLEHSRL